MPLDYDKFLESYYKKLIYRVNSSLPKRRERLMDLIKMDEPSYETIDGSRGYILKEELMAVYQRLPKNVSQELRLPFVFLRNYELGDGVYSMDGGKVEADAFVALLGLGYRLSKASDGRYFTYKPLVFEFLKRYSSLAVIGFL